MALKRKFTQIEIHQVLVIAELSQNMKHFFLL